MYALIHCFLLLTKDAVWLAASSSDGLSFPTVERWSLGSVSQINAFCSTLLLSGDFCHSKENQTKAISIY